MNYAGASYDTSYESKQKQDFKEDRFLEHALHVLQGERGLLNAILEKMPAPERLFKRLWEWHEDIGVEIERLENEWRALK